MWDEKVHPGKLVAAKEKLEQIMAGASISANGIDVDDNKSVGVAWKEEWITSIRKWTGGISVDKGSWETIAIKFPCPNAISPSKNLQNSFEIVITAGTSLMEYCIDDERVVDSCLWDNEVMHYRQFIDLQSVPANIFIWCLRFFATQLGGKIKHRFSALQSKRICKNWVFILPQHRFPGFEKSICRPNQGWVLFEKTDYDTSLELSSVLYLDKLLASFNSHLTVRAVENHFSWRGEKLFKIAQQFASSLVKFGTTIYLTCRDRYGNSYNIKILDQQNNTNDKFKADANDPTNFWALFLALKKASAITDCPAYNSSRDLDGSDVDWILHIFVDIGYHLGNLKRSLTNKSIYNVIKGTNSFDFKFPTADDHFQSFDLPHLRGTLAETEPLLLLTTYAENVAKLRDQAAGSTSSVPAAVVDIMGSYLPV